MTNSLEACFSGLRSAADAVRLVLLAALPPGIPPSFREISSAQFRGSGRQRKAVAVLEMFDGQPATVEVFRLGTQLWGHRWTDMPGGACSWEDGRWVRCDEDGNVLPDQAAFRFDPAPAGRAALQKEEEGR